MPRVVVLLFSVLLFASAHATAFDSQFTGRVLDATGAPISGAQVDAFSAGIPKPASATTDEQGVFALLLPAGRHVLEVRASGFEPWQEPIVVAGNMSRTVVLRVAGVRESVTVASDRLSASATKTSTPLRDIPQSVAVVNQDVIRDQMLASISDVVQYIPGISAHQGENNRDDVVIRGNRSSADFFLNGVRDDVQYYRDLYNVERVEALKGPNALIFGRGGAGGVVNRVTKEPQFQPLRAATIQGGTFENGRATADLDQPLGANMAFRLNGMFERSGSFRDGVDLHREAVNPTLTVNAGSRTKITAGYEFLRDRRVADRGVTSLNGRPVSGDPATYYGDPDQSAVRAEAGIASAVVEHRAGGVTLRNRTLMAGYDRFYQNFVPGAVSADASQVSLTAYNNATHRNNLFNQTDIVTAVRTGGLRHTLLTGLEFGRQLTENFRQTGFFDGNTTSIRVPLQQPTISVPVTFRQSATDANNYVRTTVAAVFAQDQIELSRHVHVLAGARLERVELRFHNQRTGEILTRTDDLVSPRAGVIVKPIEAVSLFTSYSVSHLPSAGDQFASLTSITQQLEPERFQNYEVGAKWETPAGLAVTTSVYRLDRTNTRSTDPNDPARIVQTGSQRTRGFEAGVSGQFTRAWRVTGGYAYQDAVVTSATAAAKEGARVGQVPRHSLSLWNQYQVTARVAAGLGLLHRSASFATIDNTVVLPEYTRGDAAVFFSLTPKLRLQANLENVLDTRYFLNADSNTNISPGTPRAARVNLSVRF